MKDEGEGVKIGEGDVKTGGDRRKRERSRRCEG